jgi:glutathione S-transferase
MIKLYDSALSGNCHKVRMALALLRLEHELVPADAAFRQTPEFRAINPMAQVPVLVEEDLALRDSQAILAYLAARHRPGEWDGRTPIERAEFAIWLAHAANEILNGPGFLRLGRLFGAPVHEAHHRAVADRILPVIEAHLQTRDWLACGRLTIADLAASPYLALMGDGGLALGDWPAISAWLDRIAALPTFPGMSGWSKKSA